ncbi:MAG: sodium-translocating pyrophosphatase [Wenzhouxiangella sp.]|nr:sodium-translocating pyrophosphatase [Wenzhouxiangella sp.]
MIPTLYWIAPLAVIAALSCAGLFFFFMLRNDPGTEAMQRVGRLVREGAMSYLRQQYRVMLLAFLGLAVIFAVLAWGLGLQNRWLPLTFIAGGLFSALAGYIGMQTATLASTRTAQAARSSLAGALKIAFRSGAVMGLVVVGLGLANVLFWFWLIDHVTAPSADGARLVMITTSLLTFSVGASLQALFARVGGGIYTKAADVGADLVGKVETGIPEDDLRNPAVIADNVGDNVGDVAGMGADLFESYCGSLLAAAALGAAAFFADPALQLAAVLAPMIIAGCGILLSIGGILLVRTREDAEQGELLRALGLGTNLAAVGLVLVAAAVLHGLALPGAWGFWGALVVGVATGIIVGRSTEYSTSARYRPTLRIAERATGGPATAIIAGVGVGMLSTAIPILTVGTAVLLAYGLASGFDMAAAGAGLYGIALAAVGMLSTLGITLACDAYGPIADNAGGNVEMSGLGPEARQRTDALDALGNTTAATGKGFAIGSAALTALALVASYVEVIRIELIARGQELLPLSHGQSIALTEASLSDFMVHFEVNLLSPPVLIGILFGAMTAFIFTGLTVQAVGKAAALMVEEVRRQFRETPEILAGTVPPDYARCVTISTIGAQREMLAPAVLGVMVPILTGLVLGVAGVIGLLIGGLSSGFALAIFLSNAGGAWDNAKKHIEAGHFGGKNSAAWRAAVIGDTVGDPFKDTAGPSLNILVKLMSIVAIMTAGITLSWSWL